jgi:hypothetical protein
MGFLDKVKEKAAEAIEQGKDVAQTQQLKLQLKKLESEEEEALAAFGNATFNLWESGSLSMSSDLGAAAQRIRDVRAQIEAKKAEVAAVREENGGPAEAEETPQPASVASDAPAGEA